VPEKVPATPASELQVHLNLQCQKNSILIQTLVKRKYYLKIKINLVFICEQIILRIKDISALQRI